MRGKSRSRQVKTLGVVCGTITEVALTCAIESVPKIVIDSKSKVVKEDYCCRLAKMTWVLDDLRVKWDVNCNSGVEMAGGVMVRDLDTTNR